jgi:hypothetical protein
MNLKKILAFIMICIFITGCSKSSVQGDWVLLSLEQNGVVIKDKQLDEMYGGKINYHFEEEGKLVVEMLGQKVEGQWKETGEKVIIKYNELESELTKKDNQLILEQDGFVFTLEKQAQ